MEIRESQVVQKVMNETSRGVTKWVTLGFQGIFMRTSGKPELRDLRTLTWAILRCCNHVVPLEKDQYILVI